MTKDDTNGDAPALHSGAHRGSDISIDDILEAHAVSMRFRAERIASFLGFVGVVGGSIAVWAEIGLGYGVLVAVVGSMTLMHSGWLAFALVGIVWWRGGRQDVLLPLAVVASGWWLVHHILAWPIRRVLALYSEERLASTTALRSLPESVEKAFVWLGPRGGSPISTSELLVALITTDQAARWGSLSDVVLRPGGTAELTNVATVPTNAGSVLVTSSAARSLRFSAFLSEAYDMRASAPLVALALILEGPAAEDLLARAGISQAEALDLLQGDPLGGHLDDLNRAQADFRWIETQADRARAAAQEEVPDDHKPWLPRLVNATAVALTVFVALSAVGSAAGIRHVLAADDRLDQGVAHFKAGRTDQAIQSLATVAQEYPDSLAALTGLACSLWDLGYRDHAVLYFSGMLANGYRPPDTPTNCFVTSPGSVGIAIEHLGPALRPYSANDEDPFDQELLDLLGTAAGSADTYWQAELVLACLNHRSGLRLAAASNFQAAELSFTIDSSGQSIRRIDVPDECLEHARLYSVSPSGVVVPNDAAERFYVPGVSPVPPDYDTGTIDVTESPETTSSSTGETEGE